MGSQGGQQALEVPLALLSDASSLPVIEVPALGEPLFEFAPLAEGSARAGRSQAPSPGASSSRCLVWHLEGGAQQHLLLQELAVNEERRDGAARLAFAAPLLPAVSCVEGGTGPAGTTRLAVVTADGVLHTFVHATATAAPGLARQLAAPGALTSVPLAPLLQRAGAPTAVLEVAGWVCVGTADGSIVCLPSGATDASGAITLTPTSGFTKARSKMLGGFFGRPGGQAVCQLAELRHLDSRLLAVVHESSALRLWDIGARRLVHSADLLPHPMVGSWVPTLARLTAEPLDASTSILLVYFEQVAAEAAAEPGMLCTYEIFLEQRGEGAYKVLLEMGTRLQSGIHRLQDLALENVALHTVGAWLLYDDEEGARHLHCVPLSFTDGFVHAGARLHAWLPTEVQLLEQQLVEGCPAPGASLALDQEMWRAAEGQLGAAAPTAAALAAAFADAVLAPGRLSRPALAAALARLGCGAPAEEVLAADLSELQQQLPRWVAATASTAGASATSAGGSACASAAVLPKWTALLRAYAAAWQEQHLPVALLQLAPQGDSGGMLLARRGGMITALRPAAAPELALNDSLPAEWQSAAAADAQRAAVVLEAAAAVGRAACGAQLGRLLWACLQQGQDPGSTVLPALVRSLAAGSPTTPAAASGGGRMGFPGAAAAGSGGGGGGGSVHAQWRTACRRLPLQLARLCSSVADGDGSGFAAAVEAALNMLSSEFVDGGRHRSELPALTRPIRRAALASLAQVAWAQLQAMGQLALLLQYLLWCQSLPAWGLTPEDSRALQATLLPRALQLLRAAAVAYWAAVTPAPDGGGLAGEKGKGAAQLDPADLVVSLRIGDGPPAGAPAQAPKRARLSPAQHDSCVAALLLASATASRHVHVVRDLSDLQRVSLLFAQRLLCLQASPLHAGAAKQRLASTAEGSEGGQQRLEPADAAVDVCAALFRGRHTAQLAALQRLLPADGQDMRLLFFKACSRARQIGLAATPETQRALEDESCSLFFRVAAVFGRGGAAAFPGQAAAVAQCVAQMLPDSAATAAAAADDAAEEASEQRYFQALVGLYERLGRHAAAARCALAAAHQVAATAQADDPAAQAAQSRLWASAFGAMMDAGRYEDAYVAVLSIASADIQLDCLHRLVAGLCSGAAPRGVQLLCRLPFTGNMLLVRGGRQAWVPMLEEVTATLARRAAQLDLRAAPQPYKVLADFHIARCNYQAAAAAQLAYARRLVGECPDQPAQLAEAQRALAAAVSCLRRAGLVDRQHAWVEDPAAADRLAEGLSEEPPVLTLAALQREFAIVRGHAALAAAMPGSRSGHASLGGGGGGGLAEQLAGGDAEDVFAQLLALGLHDDAFLLAEAAFVGTQLARALERCFASLAAACVRQQLGSVRRGAAELAPAGGDDMETEEVGVAAASAGAGAAAASGRDGGLEVGAVADWRRLKDWLRRYEGGEAAGGSRLRLVILEALLRAEPRFQLPPWLMAAFRPAPPAIAAAATTPAAPAGGAAAPDLAGALRVLMRYSRLADAAGLAAQHLQAALASVPSVGMARTSQVYFPAALLDQLVSQLGGGGASLAAEAQQVAALLGRVRGAALQQTPVIQQLYAH